MAVRGCHSDGSPVEGGHSDDSRGRGGGGLSNGSPGGGGSGVTMVAVRERVTLMAVRGGGGVSPGGGISQ